ncbi:MAG TPA: TetR/AcrR family transcriptional regulator C-terminal domain-containing protein [Ktedonobacteraceae bacterium]|nr:TetR/AcrR family transcriptional regulator C-terminal domain-containing protein [Ktedonobacteraceae bacterium]
MKIRPFKVSDTKPHEPALDQSQIVQTALVLLDEVGFDGLTMRNLAKKLGVQAASLYWHVRNKQDLLSLLAEEICAPMREPDRTLPWQNQLEAMAIEYRRVLLAHRDAAQVLASSGGPSGPKRLRLTEIGLRTLLDAGFSQKDAAFAGMLMNDFVIMSVLEETRYANLEAESASEDSSHDVQYWVESLPQNEYPSLVTLANYLTHFDGDERFRFGIELLRNGLESLLARRKA